MEFFPNFRTIVRIGNFYLGFYPVLLSIGAVLVYLFSVRNLKKNGYSSELGDDLFIGCTVCGVIGARLWYCVFYDFEGYFSNPISILKTWEGGLAIQGCIIGACIFVYFYAKKKRYSILRILDCIFPNILIGQALGRWGNFFNQEAYGRVVQESFYRGWPAFIKDHMYIGGEYREPTFLYESIFNIIGFFLINNIYKKYRKNRRGDLVYAYLMWYGVTRTIVETFRSDSLMLGPFKMAQLTGMFFAVIGALGTFGVFRKLTTIRPVVLFDFDQTIGNTEPIISATFRKMFEKYLPDHPFTDAERKAVLGPTLRQSFERYHFPGNVEDLENEYRVINRQMHTAELLKPMPHADELLKELKKQGYKVGIFSNKRNETVALGLDIIGLRDQVDCIVGMDDVTAHKPDPEGIRKAVIALDGNHDSCIYVGDVKNDVITGKNAHAFSIGYNVNREEADALWDAKPNAVAYDLLDILEILKGEHEWTDNLT